MQADAGFLNHVQAGQPGRFGTLIDRLADKGVCTHGRAQEDKSDAEFC